MVIYPFIAWWFSHEKCWFSSSQTVNVYQFAMRIYNPRSHLVWCCWWGGAKARFFEPLAAIFSSAFMKSDWLGIGTIGTMELYIYIYIILWLSIGNFMKTQVTNSFIFFREVVGIPPTRSVVTSCLIRTCCHRNVYIECINKLPVVVGIEYAQSPTTKHVLEHKQWNPQKMPWPMLDAASKPRFVLGAA